MAYDGRQEYVPGRRAASAGRTRPFSASPFHADGSPSLSASTPAGGFRPSRPLTAVGNRSAQSPGWAWGSPSEGGHGAGLLAESSGPKRVHVQALAGAKGREQLAEDVVTLREQVSKLKSHLSTQTVEKRRVEQELLRTKSSLLKAEELLNSKERSIGSPNMGISQLYRSPDTTHLVANLKQQVSEHKASSVRLESELRALQRSSRATKVSELQAELFAMTGEVERLSRLNQQSSKRMQDAESAAKQAIADAAQVRALALQQQPGDGRLRASNDALIGDLAGSRPGSANTSLRRTLQSMYQAHQVLLHEASQLRDIFPQGLSMRDFVGRARQHTNTAGAPDVLNFLRNHMAKLAGELSGQPGAPAKEKEGKVKEEKQASPEKSQSTMASTAQPPATVAGPDLLQSVADAVRKLRVLSERKWRDNASLQMDSEQLADVMHLYVDEVRRLQGKPPIASAAPQCDAGLQEDLDRALTESTRLQTAAKAAQSDLASSQADLLAAKSDLSATRTDLSSAQKELADWRRKAEALEQKESQLKTQLATLNQQLRDTVKSAPAAESAPKADEAVAAAPTTDPNAPPEGTMPWKVVVHTSDVSGGAFDGDVYILLSGSGYKSSGELKLPSDRYSFDCGQADSFIIHVPTDYMSPTDEVYGVGLRMGYSEAGDVTWHVAKVEVTPPAAVPGSAALPTKSFQFNDWLKAGPLNMLFPKAPRTAETAEYELQIKTSDYRGASADGQVYIMLVGDQGAASEILLEPKLLKTGSDANRMLCRGTRDIFVVRAADVGDLSNVVVRIVGADGSSKTCSWALEDMRVIHAGTGMGSMFYFYDWLSTDTPRATLNEAYTWQAWSQYTIKTVTSSLPGADFDGAVYLTLHGERGDSSELLLVTKPGKAQHSFQIGATDAFKLRGDDVGPLTSITVRMAPTSDDNLTWNVQQLSITNEDSGDTAVFSPDAWLTGATTTNFYKNTPQVQYKLTVITAADSAPFSGAVFATFNGSWGWSSEVQLVNSNCKGGNENIASFDPSGMQEFEVKERDVGGVQSVQLRVAPLATRAVAGETWKLDQIKVVVSGSDKEMKFASTDALQCTAADGGSLTLQRSLPMVEYRVQVFTCDSPDDSGFDGQVYIKVRGTDGDAEDVQLVAPLASTDSSASPAGANTAPANPFGLNASSTFVIKAADVGVMSNLEVSLKQTGSANWWRPNRLEVTNTVTSQTAVFKYDCWMNTWNDRYYLQQQSLMTYQVTVHASAASVAAAAGGKPVPFTGKLFIKLWNWQNESDEVEVPLDGPLTPGGTAVLPAIKCRVPYISNASIRVEGGTPVHVRMLEVLTEGSDPASATYLLCNQWLGTGYNTSANLDSHCMTKFKLNVCTGRSKDAGLPAGTSFFVTPLLAGGDMASKEEIEVKVPDGGCPAGSTTDIEVSTFNFSVLQCDQVRVRVEGASGTWALQRLSLTDPCNTSTQVVFANSAGKLAVPSTAVLKKTALLQYNISVTTSELRGADSDGVVMLRLIGEQGESEDLRMTSDDSALYVYGGSALSQGNTDTYSVQAVDVGAIKQVVVYLVPYYSWNDAARSRWHLAEVNVTHGGTGIKSRFPCGNWVAPGSEITLDAKDSEQTYVDYAITLTTSYSGYFNGDVWMTLVSGGQPTSQITLKGSEAVKDTQTYPGSSDLYLHTYSVRAVSLDDVTSVNVQLSPTSTDYYMCLRRINVVNKANQTGALFKFDTAWIYTWESCPRTFTATPADVYFYASVRTKNFPDAGWDGAVYLTLHGEEGDAPERSFEYPTHSPDNTSYLYWYGPEVGTLQAITVRLENGSSKKWSMDYCQVHNCTKGTDAMFEPAADIQPGVDKRVRIPKRVSTTPYDITVITGSMTGAGTDGCLYVQLEGETGTTEEIKLYDSPEDLAKNTTHTYKLTATDVGEVRKLYVRLGAPNGDTVHSAWYGAKLETLNLNSGLKCSFDVNKWISMDDYTMSFAQSSTEQVLQTYRVQVTTSSLREASFDGKAYIQLNGWYANTDEVALVEANRSTASFSAGTTQEFQIRAKDVGSYISSVNLRMVPTASDPKWHVEKVVVLSEDPNKRPTFEFYHNNWLTQECAQATLCSTSAPAKYHIMLATAAANATATTAADGSATTSTSPATAWDGQVFITFNGEYSSSPETELVNDNIAMLPGTAQEYDIDSVNMGTLASVSLRLAGGSEGRSLRLERIEVTDKDTGRRAEFVYAEPITTSSGTITAPVLLKETDYKVAFITDANAGNATPFDGDIYMTMYGMDGTGKEVKLSALSSETTSSIVPTAANAPGSTDTSSTSNVAQQPAAAVAKPVLTDGSTVVLQARGADVGALRYLYLRLDMSSTACSQYSLSAIEVTHIASGATTRLSCGSTFYAGWDCRTLYPASSTTFKVRLTTGASDGAQPFDGNIYLRLSTWYNSGKEILLQNEKGVEAFKPGAVEEFSVTCTDMSYASEATLRIEGNGSVKKWQPALVEIWDSACTTATPTGFLCTGWLTADSDSASLIVSSSSAYIFDKCEIAMAADSGPFNGSLWISAIDQNGKVSNEAQVLTAGSQVLAADAPYSLGTLPVVYASTVPASIVLRCTDNTSSSQAWKPSILTMFYGSMYRFEVAASEQGITGAGSVTLTRVPDTEYEIVATGADVPGNGTDGCIYATMEGQKGNSQEVCLWGDNERAATNTNTFNLPDLGALKRITLENRDGGSGVHSQWCVSELRVTQLTTGQRTIFECGSGTWIERAGKAELAAGNVTNVFTDYKVTVFTSADANSGFDGNARFKLESTEGRQTNPVTLAKGNLETGPFKTGGKDEFTVRGMAFDDLQRVCFDLDYAGSTTCWTIARVLVERPDTNAAWQFTPSSTLYSYNWFPAVELTPTMYYEVQLYTTTLDKTTFDGKVYLTLIGQNGDSQELPLVLYSDDLSPGKTAYSYASAPDGGQLKALRIRTEGGSVPRWPLGWVKLTNNDTSAVAMFEAPQQATIKAEASVVLPRVITTVTYEVKVYTMDETGAGTDGDVFIKLCGPNGNTDEVLLRNDDSDFQRGSCSKFTFSGPDVGDSPTVELRLACPSAEGAQVHSGWALDKVEVLNQGSGMQGTYPYGTWLNMPSACAVLTQASSQQALCMYRVRVTTGSLPGAGFDGNVWLTMSGWWGSLPEVRLAAAGQTTAHLKDGETAEFEVRGIDIGRVNQLTLRIEPTEEDPAWMLDNLEVHNTGSDYNTVFYHNNWLNTTNKELNIWANNPHVQYKVVVVTSDQADAGFDGEVYLKLSGADGQTEEVQLLNGNDSNAEATPFLPASTRECLLRAANVASLRSASLRIVASKKEKKWHLDRLEVVVVPSDGSEAGPAAVFNYRNWIEDSSVVDVPRHLATADYRVTLNTTDQPDAGFDGDVYITLHGSDGDTAEYKLDLYPATSTVATAPTAASAPAASAGGAAPTAPAAPATDATAAPGAAASVAAKLAPGSSITVPLTASDVGQISRVDVRVVSTGKEGCSTSWHLATLSLLQVSNGATLQFPYRSWVHESSGTHTLYLPSSYTYKVKVYTSQESSDFDGNVLIKLCNYWSNSKEESLAAARTTASAFKPGSCEEFTIKVDDVGWLSSLQLRVEQAAASSASRWHCSHIEVVNESGDTTYAFHVHDWMATKDTESREFSVTNMAACDVTLYLAPADAGTPIQLEDLQLYATVCGKGAELLTWSEAKLELSAVDVAADAMTTAGGTAYQATVKVPALQCGSAGAKLQVRAAAGSSGNNSKWLLSRAQVWDTYNWNNHCFFFGGSLTPAAKLTAESLTMEDYDVTFYTSDVRGNGHDGSVSLVLEGLQYVSNELYLTTCNCVTAADSASSTTSTMFERGSVDTFSISAPNLGKLRSCVLKLAGGHSCWRVDKVDVLHRASGALTSFNCQQWLQPYDSSSSSSSLTRLAAPDATTDAQVDWDITVWTAPASDAAFDGEVSLQLFDSKGRSTCMMVLGSGADGLFKVGARDVVKVRGLTLSDLQRAKVRLNNTGSSSTWRCARIQASNKATGATGMFAIDDLISCWSGDAELSEASLKSYSVMVWVGEGSQMDTEAYITLHGSDGVSKELKLQCWDTWPTYYSDDWRSFSVNAYAVGVLKAITLRTANSQPTGATAPLLRYITVTVDETGVASEFRLDKPFPVSDKVIINKKLDTTKYQLQVCTADYRGSSTDADVYVSIKGDDGEVEEFKLNNAPDNFDKGKKDTFSFSNVVVGTNKSLTFRLVGADGKPPHSSWYLNHASLTDLNSGDKTMFYQYGWVNADAPTTIKESYTSKGLYPYSIKTVTGSAKEAGFEGEIWIRLSGWYGQSAEMLLAQDGATSHNFMPSALDTFSIKAEDLGSITSIDIVRVVPAPGSETAAGWQLESLTVDNVESGYVSEFEFSNWVTDSSTPLTLYRNGANLPYKVAVYTSSTSTVPAVKQPLLITLKGMLGECDENKLVSESDSPLAPGSKEEFSLKDSDVGALTQITLGIKQEKEGEQPPSWVCDRVEVLTNDPPTSTALFPCAAAASATPSWQLVNGTWTLQLSRQLPDAQYTIAVSTTDVADALYDGDVMVTLNGSDGTTGEVRLPADKPYNPAQKDSFSIKAGDIGALTSVTVALKPRSGGSTQWHLSDISVAKGSAGVPFKFTCNSYLNDGNPSVTLYQQGPCKYDATLVTTNTPEAAGFVGDVFLALSGQYGSCPEIKLVPANQPPLDAPEAMRNAAAKASALDPGNAAAWQLSAPADVGPITNVTLRVLPADGSQLKKWHCARVVLRSERDPSNPHAVPVNDWIQGGKEVTIAARKMIPYNMEVVVPDGSDATAVPVLVTLLGSDGVTSEDVTVNPPSDAWTAGTNTVNFEAMDCGTLTGMRISATSPAGNTAAATAALQLQYVKLYDSNSGSLAAAFCKPGGGVVSLAVGAAPISMEVLQQVTYTVEVNTGNARGAGTNGSVSITLMGDKGSTQAMALSNDWWSDFERGHTDSFDVGSVDVGVIRSIKLEVSGAQSGWLLDSVRVTNPGTSLQHTFKYGSWTEMKDQGCVLTLSDPSGGKKA